MKGLDVRCRPDQPRRHLPVALGLRGQFARGAGWPGFGLTLTVHMAALVAADASPTGQRPADDMTALTMYLLDREQFHWSRLADDGTSVTEGPATGLRRGS